MAYVALAFIWHTLGGAEAETALNSLFVAGDPTGESSDQNEGPPVAVSKGQSRHASTVDDERGRSRSVFRRFFGPSGSRDSSLVRGGHHGRTEAEGGAAVGGGGNSRNAPVGMERLSAPVLHLLGAVDTLTDWESAREKATLTGSQKPTSGLQRWLVRLHIVSLYLQRLPGLRTKLLQEAEKRIICRCPRDVEAVHHLQQLQGRGAGEPFREVASKQTKDEIQARQQAELAEASLAVDDAIDALTQKLQETAKEICRSVSSSASCCV